MVRIVGDEHLGPSAKRFIRKHLSTRPARSLSSRLARMVKDVPNYEVRSVLWARETEALVGELTRSGRAVGDVRRLPDRLASARNALAHGDAISDVMLAPACRILQMMLRGQLLTRLDFTDNQLAIAYERMARDL